MLTHEENAPVNLGPGFVVPDPKALPPIKVPADMQGTMTPERAEAAKGVYRAAGYSEEQLTAAFPVNKDAPRVVMAPGAGVSLSAEDLTAKYQYLADHSSLPIELIAREAKAAGAGQIKDPRTKQFVAAPGADFTPAPEYRFQFSGLFPDQALEHVAAFTAQAAAASASLGLDNVTAQAAIRSFIETSNAVPDGTDAETMAQRWEKEGSYINTLKDSADIIRLAKVGETALAAAAPALHKYLTDAWAFHSAESQLALYRIGLSIESRKK
jgi:hypothetical protein